MPQPIAATESRGSTARALATVAGARRRFRVSNPWLHRSRFVARSERQLRVLVGRIWPGQPLIIEAD